ncbi:HNH endonuclease signature motif containing protein [Corynebacterium frankenforstense]|uniref:HNH endonuclease signature motif containing protein n=1 Tax=Corynebacterium frankenforstense TaxID=1230998 RepID=UPI000952714F|nr:HNH endonuclease signature motif containing protein [Corynebacterium frankenforstense]
MTATTKNRSDDPRVAEITALARTCAESMEKISEILDSGLDAHTFTATIPAIKELETSLASKAMVDAAFAHLSEVHRAGNLAGTSKTHLFLTETLGISRKEAWARIEAAKSIYGPAQPAAAGPGDPGTGSPGADQDSSGQTDGNGQADSDGQAADAESSTHTDGDSSSTSGDESADGTFNPFNTFAPFGSEREQQQHEQQEREKREREQREREERRRREDEERAREEAKRRAAEERRRKAEADKREANRLARARKLAAEKARIIDTELKTLLDSAIIGREELRKEAILEADKRSPEDLRAWLRSRIAEVNLGARDPLAPYKNRYAWLSPISADGSATLQAKLTPPMVALVEELFADALKPGTDIPDLTPDTPPGDGPKPTKKKDNRTAKQRKCDAFFQALAHYAAATDKARGCAGLLISLTAEHLDEIDEAASAISRNLETLGDAGRVDPDRIPVWRKAYPTNTSVDLTLFDMLALQASAYDIEILHSRNGDPLHAGRSLRPASFMQKAALVATELVCSYPGCTEPAIACEVHHLVAWLLGGRTDVENLTLRCKDHHGDNNDRRDPQWKRGWADRDPETGRVGHTGFHTADGLTPVDLNETSRARRAAGSKIRDANADPPEGSPPRAGAPGATDNSEPTNDPGTPVPEAPDWLDDYEDYLAERAKHEESDATDHAGHGDVFGDAMDGGYPSNASDGASCDDAMDGDHCGDASEGASFDDTVDAHYSDHLSSNEDDGDNDDNGGWMQPGLFIA